MAKVVKWRDMEFEVKDFMLSHANGGRLSKFWVTDKKTGRAFLIKGSSGFNYEPFSEKIAYIVGKSLGIDILEYDIIPSREFKGIIKVYNPFCRYVSICEKIDRKGYSITSVAEIKRARNAILKAGEKPITNREVMYELLSKNYIETMMLFDAIIGNNDRHYGNVHLLRSTDGEIIGAPILDNGASILANTPLLLARIAGYKVGELFNRAFTTAKTHDEQMESVERLTHISFNIPVKTMEILREIEPTLELMPKVRARIIRTYLVYRIHKYLGMIKYADSKDYFEKHKKYNKRKMTEKESSTY